MLDRVTTGPKPALVEGSWAPTYHTGAVADLGLQPDIVVECTGVVPLVQQAAAAVAPGRHRVPHRRRSAGRVAVGLGFGAGHRGRAQEPRAVRLGERQPPPLLPGGEGARQRPTGPGSSNSSPAGRPRRRRQALASGAGRHQGRHGVRTAMTAGIGGGPRGRPRSRGGSAAAGLLTEGPRWDADAASCCGSTSSAATMHRGPPGVDGALESVRDHHVGPACRRGRAGHERRLRAGRRHGLPARRRRRRGPRAGPAGSRAHRRADERRRLRRPGRFWAGTMAYDESPGAGALYRLELDGSCTTVLTGLTISNGIGWSPDGATMYLADSGTGRVDAFDFDADQRRHHAAPHDRHHRRARGRARRPHRRRGGRRSGSRCGRRRGPPLRAPTATLLTAVPLPVDRPTSCAFGGRDRSTLFVTTARHGLDDVALSVPTARRASVLHRGSGSPGRGVRPLPWTHPLVVSQTAERQAAGGRDRAADAGVGPVPHDARQLGHERVDRDRRQGRRHDGHRRSRPRSPSTRW